MPLGGDRVIITLQTAVRDRGRWLVIAPVLSLCRRRNVDCGRLSGMTQQSLLTSVNDQDNISGWDMLSSRHDACGCRVLPLGSPDRGACHMSSGESGWSCSGQRYAPRVIRGRGPYISAFVFCVLFCAFVFYFFLFNSNRSHPQSFYESQFQLLWNLGKSNPRSKTKKSPKI